HLGRRLHRPARERRPGRLRPRTEAPSAVLLFRASVGGREIHGIDLLHLDDDGRIKEFTVMVRPASAVQALGEAVLAGLVADGLVPAP
ncbi:hypothetical protein ACFXMR_18725, partial [Streptomyces griseus]